MSGVLDESAVLYLEFDVVPDVAEGCADDGRLDHRCGSGNCGGGHVVGCVVWYCRLWSLKKVGPNRF